MMPVSVTPAFAQSIDEFDGKTAETSVSFTFDDSDILGGQREVFIGANATISITGGQLVFSSVEGLATTQIRYDGNEDDPTLNFELGGVDLTANGADRFQFFVSAFTSNPSVSISIHEAASNSLRVGPITVNSTGLVELLFSDLSFMVGAGADITSVNAVQLTFSDNTASGGPGSVTLDYFRTNGIITETVFEDRFEDQL